jgi:hypothetical protein
LPEVVLRIIDKRKDYYDIGMGLGHDDNIVYVREPKDIVLNPQNPRRYIKRFDTIFVGFCGKIYPAIVVYSDKYDTKNDIIKGVCYTIEEVDKFIHANFDKKDIESYENSTYKGSLWSKSINLNWSRNSLIRDFERMKERTHFAKIGHYQKLFIEYNTPIWVIDYPNNEIHINCLLKPWEFYKIFDAYTAFQEISMYVGGVLLAPVNPVPNIPDDTMRDIKGFDKWSFRKEPSEK